MKTKEEILDVVFGPDTDYKYKPFPAVKKAMQEYADQQLTEYKRKLKEAFEKADYEDVLLLPDYFKLIDAFILLICMCNFMTVVYSHNYICVCSRINSYVNDSRILLRGL